LSADGRFIVYTTGAVADFETIGVPSTVFIKDLQTGVETPLTTNNGFEDYRVVDVSANGRFVLFEKKEAFALTNTEADDEFIVVDTLTGNTRSVLAQPSFTLGTHALDISEDGRYVIYQEVQPASSEHGIYEYDLQTG